MTITAKAMRADRDLAYSKLQEISTANESALATHAVRCRCGMDLDEEILGQSCSAVQVTAVILPAPRVAGGRQIRNLQQPALSLASSTIFDVRG